MKESKSKIRETRGESAKAKVRGRGRTNSLKPKGGASRGLSLLGKRLVMSERERVSALLSGEKNISEKDNNNPINEGVRQVISRTRSISLPMGEIEKKK